MHRICFTLRIDPDRIDEYRDRHRHVWPEMRRALSESGWHNYSLFLRPDGLLIGYLECEDFDECRAAMARTEINARWQAEMSAFFVGNDDTAPDTAMRPIEEVFHLDDS